MKENPQIKKSNINDLFLTAKVCTALAPPPPPGGSAVLRNTGILYGHECAVPDAFTALEGTDCNQIEVKLLSSGETNGGFLQVFEFKLKKLASDMAVRSTALISFTAPVDIATNEIVAQTIVSSNKKGKLKP